MAEDDEILERLNDEKAKLYIPVIVFFGFLAVLGFVGNIIVCFVYIKLQRKSSTHYFILSLAVLDLLSCLIGMPTEMADLMYPYMFYATPACRLLRFTESVSIIGSAFVLIIVAFDRFYKVCDLRKMFTVYKSKVLCVVCSILGVILSWPAAIIFGHKTKHLEYNITGVDCSTDDSMAGTIYPTLYYGSLAIIFLVTVMILVVLYAKIGREIWRRKMHNFGRKWNERSPPSAENNISFTDRDSADIPEAMSSDSVTDQNSNTATSSSKYAQNSKSSTPTRNKNTIRVGRSAFVLFVVTCVFIVSFLPFLVTMILRSAIKGFEETLSSAEEVVYKFCIKSYFVNNSVNPIIYSFLNPTFRKDTRKLFRRICKFPCGVNKTFP